MEDVTDYNVSNAAKLLKLKLAGACLDKSIGSYAMHVFQFGVLVLDDLIEQEEEWEALKEKETKRL